MTGVLRRWRDSEIEQLFGESDIPVVRDLFRPVQAESHDGQIRSLEAKAVPAFNFYLRVRLPSGGHGGRVALQYRLGEAVVRLYLNWEQYLVSESVLTAYAKDLKAVFGARVDVSMREPTVSLALLADKLQEFERVFLAFRDAVVAEL